MDIIHLRIEYTHWLDEAALLLFSEFKKHWPEAWPTVASAQQEVKDSVHRNKICRIAVEEDHVIGWVGAIPMYNGNVWEVHPLVVQKENQGKGVGRALMKDLEDQVIRKNGHTLWLGTDDEDGMTSVSGCNLYPNPMEKLMQINNIKNHPYEFYLKCGFSLVGILPDANGFGKPDIYMAKRIIHKKV